MFYCTLKTDLSFMLSLLETNYAYFSQVKFLVFNAKPEFSKLFKSASLDEQDRISITKLVLFTALQKIIFLKQKLYF